MRASRARQFVPLMMLMQKKEWKSSSQLFSLSHYCLSEEHCHYLNSVIRIFCFNRTANSHALVRVGGGTIARTNIKMESKQSFMHSHVAPGDEILIVCARKSARTITARCRASSIARRLGKYSLCWPFRLCFCHPLRNETHVVEASASSSKEKSWSAHKRSFRLSKTDQQIAKSLNRPHEC